MKTNTRIIYKVLNFGLSVVGHTCNPSTWEAEAGGSQVGRKQNKKFTVRITVHLYGYFVNM
jgi:hypothetical protein